MGSSPFRSQGILLLVSELQRWLSFPSFIEVLSRGRSLVTEDRYYVYVDELRLFICVDLKAKEAYRLPDIVHGDLSSFPLADSWELAILSQSLSEVMGYAALLSQLCGTATYIMESPTNLSVLGDRGLVRDGCLFWFSEDMRGCICIDPLALTVSRLKTPTADLRTAVHLTTPEIDALQAEINNYFIVTYEKILQTSSARLRSMISPIRHNFSPN